MNAYEPDRREAHGARGLLPAAAIQWDDWLTILQGDAIEKLRTLPAESIQCCVTSPPYWGLRDYGTATWEGGDGECDHLGNPMRTNNKESDSTASFHGGTSRAMEFYRDQCGKCGATRIDSQIGLEETPEQYLAKMVEVFREVWRVLKDDGTLWLNLGDSYASPIGGNNIALRTAQFGEGNERGKKVDELDRTRAASSVKKNIPGLKPKDLVGIPWRVAFALQADGWYLRSDIIWSKPNPMPESVTDRPTKAHEYIFLLSKNERYFYDAETIKESGTGRSAGNVEPIKGAGVDNPFFRTREGFLAVANTEWHNRNKRSVWTVPTAPYPDAHFATYPPDLIKPCILAGTKAGDVVLDPFAGSGTTGMVAIELGRKATLIELNPAYVVFIERRCDITPGLPL